LARSQRDTPAAHPFADEREMWSNAPRPKPKDLF
jgi:hypothetical protein